MKIKYFLINLTIFLVLLLIVFHKVDYSFAINNACYNPGHNQCGCEQVVNYCHPCDYSYPACEKEYSDWDVCNANSGKDPACVASGGAGTYEGQTEENRTDLGTLFGSDLQSVADGLTNLFIAIGVVASALIIPYIVVQFNIGTVDSIKKAQGWLFNLMGGLILLLLGGFIIQAIGQSVFGIGP